jgi:polysaccharide export outer membrane protein
MVAKFDYGQIRQGTMLDPILEPGDRVVMGTDGLSQFWEDLLMALPAFGIFAAAGLN